MRQVNEAEPQILSVGTDRLRDPLLPSHPSSLVTDTDTIRPGQRPRVNKNEEQTMYPEEREQDGSLCLLRVMMAREHTCRNDETTQ